MDDNQMYMRIGEFADFFDISQKALRIYEKMEILRPAYIDEETGYRYYSADQVKQLNAVIELKALGFTLKEIKSILQGGTDSAAFVKMLKKRYSAWNDQKMLAERKMEAVLSIRERFEKLEGTKKMEEMTEDERAWLLAKMVCVEDVRVQHLISEAIWL
ncbi:MAG TPA: MerR family transcriptional regulator [Lachnospiraceae bacterium]|nr:MerR family transcriptional regulator [Lachnospiraceae bacterium]